MGRVVHPVVGEVHQGVGASKGRNRSRSSGMDWGGGMAGLGQAEPDKAEPGRAAQFRTLQHRADEGRQG